MTEVIGLPATELVAAPGLLRCIVHLVRHGESTWNLQRRVQGQHSAPELTDLGRRQAAAAAGLLADSGATLLLTSDLTRAVQTADIIGAATGLVPVMTPLLREQSLGSLEGMTTADAGAALAGIDLTDPDTPYGDGESRSDVRARFERALGAGPFADAAPGDEVVLVSHGDTIRIAVAHLLADDPVTGPWRPINNGAVITVYPADRRRRRR